MLDVGVTTLARAECGVQSEQSIGMLGAERAAVGGVTGLQQHRMALRPGGQRRGAADGELRTPVLDGVNTGGVDIDAVVAVGQHGVGCPAVPDQNARATVMNSSARR